ncbi:CLUMA_CG005604, isoform A [Clunio marinus]|uniref:CLUMA_CG005604, isoform A n=1 Tax=Clunio marinus TaxID=568069 RepID=A0A1J1HVB9_9DIPT|nr:CLUMA_CG005604, isoform A [Clunio marinus]
MKSTADWRSMNELVSRQNDNSSLRFWISLSLISKPYKTSFKTFHLCYLSCSIFSPTVSSVMVSIFASAQKLFEFKEL